MASKDGGEMKKLRASMKIGGLKVEFIGAPTKEYIPYLRFSNYDGTYLGAMDKKLNRRQLLRLREWITKVLK